MIRRAVKSILLFSLLFASLTNVFAARQFIIDTDVGIDDAIAILYLLNRPDIEVRAITIVSDGNAHCRPAMRNTLGMLHLLGKNTIPVACGGSRPLAGDHHFPPSVWEESDTLMGAAKLLPQVATPPSQTAMGLLLKTVQTAHQPIDILAIGPLTNIAGFISSHPDLKNKIRMIYLMGGAINVPGNILDVDPNLNNKVAEWNIYLDPLAASIVFRSGIPITMISLDVTNQLPITKQFYARIKANQKSPQAKFMYELFKHNEKMLRSSTWYFWDPLAAVVATDESIATIEDRNLRVVLTPDSQSGATVVDDKNGNKVRVCVRIDKEQFEKILLLS